MFSKREAPSKYQACALFGSSSVAFCSGSIASARRFALYRLMPKLRQAVAAFGGANSPLFVLAGLGFSIFSPRARTLPLFFLLTGTAGLGAVSLWVGLGAA